MRTHLWFVSIVFILAAGQASADQKADCLKGIDQIKAEIAKKPPGPVLDKLRTALDTAEQETFEGDWDECLGAIRTGKKALGR